jgi:hypothetical protein
MGDFNIDLLKANSHSLTSEFLDLNLANSLIPCINRPTRVTGTTATLIDNIFSNLSNNSSNFQVIIPIGISDHFPVCHFNIDPVSMSEQERSTHKRDFSRINMNAFNEGIRLMDWTNVMNEQDAQKAYAEFHKLTTVKFEKSFPYKKITSQYNNRLPWLTPAIKKSIIHKHKLYSKQLKFHTQDNISKYKLYRNKLNHVLRVTERTYYQKKIEEYKSNLRKSWKIINEVINRKKRNYIKNDYLNINGLRTSDPKMIADHFNHYFTNIGPNLDAKIKTTLTNPIDYIQNPQPNSIFLNN